ncbi:MAG: HAMP domain-containing methyl-accepting chemotaxis protein [Bacillota bacterium]|nr:HAMP domain-containing methyl-accepting chemotaxis protein [Bacillota bacterium]MDW7685387.1 HAMP domain-containing methyl-accepting chemotaxis protein [Bacillota bacterium]
MLSRSKELSQLSKVAEILQKVPLGIKLKLLISLVFALLISPMVAAVIESMVIRFTGLENFSYFALVQAGISLLTASGIILVLINILVMAPINQIMLNAGKISKGNLTDFNNIASRDEMGKLADTIHAMQVELRSIVSDVRKTAEQINRGGEEINAATESNVAAVEQIAASANDFAERAQNINSKIKKVSDVATTVAAGIKKGEAELGGAAKYTETTKATIKNSVEEVQALNRLAEEITKVVQIITDISDETHLLSFNASIEAARAGEHGRGFAVVADQIGKLADESKRSAKEINIVVNSIQDKTKQTIEEIVKSEEDIDKTSQMMNLTEQVLSSAISELDVLFADINLISESTEEINATTQEIAASTQEQSASLQEVSALTHDFRNTVTALQTLLEKFSL